MRHKNWIKEGKELKRGGVKKKVGGGGNKPSLLAIIFCEKTRLISSIKHWEKDQS